MDVIALFALQFLMSLVVWGSLAYWLLAPWLEKKSLNELPENHLCSMTGSLLSDRASCVSSHWTGVPYPGSGCSTAAGNFCRSCCLWEGYQNDFLTGVKAGVPGAGRSSE